MKTDDDRPEFPVPAQEKHDAVTFFDPQGLEIVRSPGTVLLHLEEGEAAFILVPVEVDHAQPVRLLLRDGIHHVKGKIELLCILEADLLGISVFALFHGDEIGDKVRSFECVRRGLLFDFNGFGACQTAVLPLEIRAFFRKDDRKKADRLAFCCDDAVRIAGIVENAVAGVEHFLVVLDPDLHGSLKDIVEFLPGMGDLLDRCMLQLLGIIVDDKVGVGDPIFEEGSDVLDDDARLNGGQLTVAAACQGVSGQERRFAFKEFHDLDVEHGSALVNEGEGQVGDAALIGDIVTERKSRHIRHLFLCVAHIDAERVDTAGYLLLKFCC